MNSQQTLSLSRWQRLCQAFGIRSHDAIEREFQRLVIAYGEPHRAYHTAQHINECLNLLDWAVEHEPSAGCSTLEMALWYHDVVYQPGQADNERRSADQALAFLHACDVDLTFAQTVESLIMATCHLVDTKLFNSIAMAGWMTDIDLAILGASPQRFSQYNNQIRQEYNWVSEVLFRAKRQEILTQFLKSLHIYQSILFRERFEIQARKNLRPISERAAYGL